MRKSYYGWAYYEHKWTAQIWTCCVDLFIRFYDNNNKKNLVLTINQINMNYEKPNK